MQVLLERQINICERLRLNALRGVNYQHGTLDGLKTARNFVRKINVTRRVNQIKRIAFILHANRREFDSDSLFALELHRVKQLRLHLALGDSTGNFKHAVSQSRLTMVNVRNNTKITDLIYIHVLILSYCQAKWPHFARSA